MTTFLIQATAAKQTFDQYGVEFLGEDAFIRVSYSDGRPLVVHGVPGVVAAAAAARAGSRPINLGYTSKRLMDVGEPAEHWCARYLWAGFE
jgi:hypothetical protein